MNTFKLSALSLALLPLLGYAEEIETNQNKAQRDVDETIEVVGQRNQAYTEPNEKTQKLLAVAGLDGDPLSSVFSLPGVVYAGGDDGGEPAIRGSSPDDNAFYIDSLPVDYIFHLFGDSIFNKNLVRDFDLDPAGFNASYGNAIGGVFDVKLRDPRNQELTTTLDWSMIKAGAMVEGGITENTAFYASYRRSLIHLFLGNGDELEDDVKVYQAPQSDDYQVKWQWLAGTNHKLSLSLNGASDKGGINIADTSEWGRANPDVVGDLSLKASFDSASAQWEYFGDNSDYINFVVGQVKSKEKEHVGAGQFTKIDQTKLVARALYQTDLGDHHRLNLGVDFTDEDIEYSYDFIPYYCTEHDPDCVDRKGERIQDESTFLQRDYGIYLSDSWQILPILNAEIGVRAEKNDYTDQTFVHPRIAVNLDVTDDLRLTGKAGTYSRFPDVGKVVKVIGNPELKSPESTHFALKADYQFNDDWKSSVEVYHKSLDKLPASIDEELDTANLRYVNETTGKAYGVEWVLEKALSDGWYGWASVSWSKSERTDERTGVTTEYYLDTPLILNMVANYKLNERWTFGARLTGRSGAKYTPIVGIKENPDYPDHYIPDYGELNSDTLPVYHRLDLQADYSFKAWGQEAKWTFAVLNALNAKNVSGYYFAPDGNETPENYTIEEEEGMGMFPSIGFQISF